MWDFLEDSLVNQAFLTTHLFFLTLSFSGFFFLGFTHLIFMSVWFKSFSVFHYFLKTGAVIQSLVIWVKLTIYESMYESNQFVFKQIKQVNDEEQFLQTFYSFYFEIKYKNKICMHNNIKKDYRSKLLNKGIIGVVMSF